VDAANTADAPAVQSDGSVDAGGCLPAGQTGVSPGRYSWLIDTGQLLPPDASRIVVTDTDGWYAHVHGSAGSVAANRPVLVLCLDLSSVALVQSGAGGDFDADLLAPPGCTLQVKHDPLNQFLTSAALTDPRPNQINVPPGTLVHHSPTVSGSTAVKMVGRVTNGLDPFMIPGLVPYTLQGTLNTLQFNPGDSLTLSGTLHVLLPSGATVPGTNATVQIGLQSIADSNGHWTGGHQKFGSVLFSPVGAPIERWETGEVPFGASTSIALSTSGLGDYQGTFSIQQSLPPNLGAGYYRPYVHVDWQGAQWNPPLATKPEWAMYAYNADRNLAPMIRVGAPAAPTLPFMLLSDAIHNGVRGVEDPAQSYRTAQRIGEAPSFNVFPRLDTAGNPRAYRLEPVLPYLSFADRGVVRSPFIDFDLPGGSFTVTVTGPGVASTLGPAVFRQTRSSTPATVGGLVLDFGGGNLGDALELSAGQSPIAFTFPSDGRYTIRLQGSLNDHSGFTWNLDGTFQVQIAESLDLDPPVLPGYPFQAGERLPIAVQVSPSVPATVTARVRFAPNSGAASTQTFTGTANRFGYFYLGDSFQFAQAGEYHVELSAIYPSPNGDWAGVMAFSGVVAEATPSIVVHGRRGIDATIQPTLDRYTRASTGIAIAGDHMNFPYRSGDVLLQTNLDSAQVRASFFDPSGTLASFFQGHPFANDGVEGAAMAARFSAGEAPFVSKTTSGLDVTLDPAHTDLYAYYYAAVDRAGERVRGGATEDNTDTYYWRFDEEYAAQPGMGSEGDLPADVKVQYVGGVVRTPSGNHYGRYASLWGGLLDGDPVGSRVVAPLSGPLMTIDSKPIAMTVLPTLTRAGTVLEVGGLFGFAAQVAPPIASMIHVDLLNPDGTTLQSWDLATNEIGGFTDSTAGRVMTTPGLYSVRVGVTSGAMTGGLFSETEFILPVVSTSAPLLGTTLPAAGVVHALGPVQAELADPTGMSVHSMITIPGWILNHSFVDGTTRATPFCLDPAALRAEYPLVDVQAPHAKVPGMADEFVWVLTAGAGAGLKARRAVFFGPALANP
jgi:hypothetical protein